MTTTVAIDVIGVASTTVTASTTIESEDVAMTASLNNHRTPITVIEIVRTIVSLLLRHLIEINDAIELGRNLECLRKTPLRPATTTANTESLAIFANRHRTQDHLINTVATVIESSATILRHRRGPNVNVSQTPKLIVRRIRQKCRDTACRSAEASTVTTPTARKMSWVLIHSCCSGNAKSAKRNAVACTNSSSHPIVATKHRRNARPRCVSLSGTRPSGRANDGTIILRHTPQTTATTKSKTTVRRPQEKRPFSTK